MRRACQVYLSSCKQCEEPAVDYVQLDGRLPKETLRVWMCAKHWDEWMRKDNAES